MTMLREKITTRIPDFQSTLQVFSVISLFFYGWMFAQIFWIIQSWMKNLVWSEILALISYSMVLSLLESLLILAGLLLVSLILPARFFRDMFVTRGTLLAICILSSILLHWRLAESDVKGIVQSLRIWWSLTVVVTLFLVWLLPKFRIVKKVVYELADRSLVFLYLFIPITLIGFGLIVIRLLVSA